MAQCIRCGRTLSGFTFGKKICVWCKQYEAAQRGEDTGYQPVMATPWQRRESMPMLVTQIIFGINVAVFVGMLLAGVPPMSPTGASLLAWGANFGPYTLTGDWWRLLTSCFVHAGIIHIAFNMWCLWSLGGLAERLYGRATFACVYLLCGLSGSLGSVLWHRPPTVSVGASGAIFGIAGAVIASIRLGEFASGVMPQGVMQSLIAFVGYNVVFGAISGGTDNACHFGGLAAGLLLGALIAKVAPEPRLMPRLGVLALVAVMLGGGGYALQRVRAFPYYIARAQEQVEDGKIDSALPYYEAAAKLRPDSAGTIYSGIGSYYWDKKDFAAAEREMQKAVAATPGNPEYLYDLGEVRLSQHRIAEARQSFSQLQAMNPKSAEAHVGFGAAALDESNYALALGEYQQAAALNPGLPGIYQRLGDSRMGLKQYEDAIAAYRKEIEVSGDNEECEQKLAAAYKAKGMSAESEAATNRAAELAKNRQE